MKEDIKMLDRRYIEIKRSIEKFKSLEIDFILPVKLGKKILRDIDTLKWRIKKISPPSQYEKLLLQVLKEKLICLEVDIKMKVEGKITYENYLRRYGLKKKDIEKLRKYFEELKPRKMVEEYADKSTSLYWKHVRTEKYFKKAKKEILRLLKMCYFISPIKKYFTSFNQYLETIDFAKSGISYCHGNKVIFSLGNLYVVYFHNGLKIIEDIDIFRCASLVGEEAAIGHQAHNIITDNSNIPYFLKDTYAFSRIHGEIIGKLGSFILIEKIKENRIIKKEYKDIFELLKTEEEYFDKKVFVRDFINNYKDFLRLCKNKSISEIVNYMYYHTGNKIYLSDFFKKKLKAWYDVVILGEIEDCALDWVYIYSRYFSLKIYEKIKKLDEKEKENILRKLYLGYWTKDSFEKYVNEILKL